VETTSRRRMISSVPTYLNTVNKKPKYLRINKSLTNSAPETRSPPLTLAGESAASTRGSPDTNDLASPLVASHRLLGPVRSFARMGLPDQAKAKPVRPPI
jgi:hypothetical protein